VQYEHYRDKEEYFKFGRNRCSTHFHRSIEIICCINNGKEVYIDGEHYTMNVGDLLFLPPFTVHHFPETDKKVLCVVMPVEYSDIFEEAVGEKRIDKNIFTDHTVTNDIFDHLLKLEYLKSKYVRDGIYRYVLGTLLDNCELVLDSKKKKSLFAVEVLTYLGKKYNEKITLESVASALGYNRCYFSTVFKEYFHTGFCDYLSTMRVEKSLPLLRSATVNEAAMSVGFGSLQSYYSAFKRVKGMSPAAYKLKKKQRSKSMKLSEINIRDPFILTYKDKYYMYGSRVGQPYAGSMWGDQFGFDVYVSDDMENWSSPKCIFEKNDSFWGKYHFWAPEVHFYNGKFYLVASFKADGKCRGTHILVSDVPDGMFTPISETPATPADWECLDGTLYVDKKGKPHLVFCHEWLQIDNGTVCEVELSSDLARAVSEPRVLWCAKDYPNVKAITKKGTGFVTDGPFFYRCENGDLVCIWSTHDKDTGYVELLCKSSNGDIDGEWTLLDKPLFDKDGGHGMIFTDLEGKLRFVMHSPNTILLERPRIMSLFDKDGVLSV